MTTLHLIEILLEIWLALIVVLVFSCAILLGYKGMDKIVHGDEREK